MQNLIVILALAASLALLGWKGYRTFFPPAGKSCGGDCCGAGGKSQPAGEKPGKPERIMMVRSVDLSRRAAEIRRQGAGRIS